MENKDKDKEKDNKKAIIKYKMEVIIFNKILMF